MLCLRLAFIGVLPLVALPCFGGRVDARARRDTTGGVVPVLGARVRHGARAGVMVRILPAGIRHLQCA
ncbi:conserved protein of unknown function (plasmid) [Paraburkholderia dioscoreae]|uniref:Uncharacterized protein n=1 Tax=Paraburkholderia dioscoreae TaxID=2604047 RepID=A0A5Q4ZQP5_9BURK|nr:conserved protein of unknown function [Paraburkholderia dioscoreae]